MVIENFPLGSVPILNFFNFNCSQLTAFQFSAPGGKPMQISVHVYYPQDGVRWGGSYPIGRHFVSEFTNLHGFATRSGMYKTFPGEGNSSNGEFL